MQKARISIENGNVIGKVEREVFGSLVEHLGRSVYRGIYEPTHPRADQFGFREDVMDLAREMGVTIVRYPGGNFVSNYDWEDGIGPIERRPHRLDLAWRSLETNEVGVNEFASWCKRLGAEPMMALNFGTRGLKEAMNLLEYCNHPSGSYWSDLRISHGYREPHNIRTWCLGNEMDGEWQVGNKTAEEYGRLAAATGRAMRMFDPTLRLVCCGSSHTLMDTFPDWEAVTLTHTYDVADYISLHQYFTYDSNDSDDFLAQSMETERFINTVIAVCDYVKAKKRSKKNMLLSFDEWNLWYHSKAHDEKLMQNRPWGEAPDLLADVYTFEDALLAGCMLITFLKHADRLKMACIAQLVNVIAPIMTETGGGICRQTTFYPFMHAAQFGKGSALRTFVAAQKHDTLNFTDVSALESVAVESEDGNEITVFAVNRSLTEDVLTQIRLHGYENFRLTEHIALECDDLKAVNTVARPNRVAPVVRKDSLVDSDAWGMTIALHRASWNVLRFHREDAV